MIRQRIISISSDQGVINAEYSLLLSLFALVIVGLTPVLTGGMDETFFQAGTAISGSSVLLAMSPRDSNPFGQGSDGGGGGGQTPTVGGQADGGTTGTIDEKEIDNTQSSGQGSTGLGETTGLGK